MKNKPITPDNSDFDSILDLKGITCPMTFVYTKVALEKMKSGQILKVILDFKSAFINVPDSVEKQKLGVILQKIISEKICYLRIQRI